MDEIPISSDVEKASTEERLKDDVSQISIDRAAEKKYVCVREFDD